MHCYCSVVGEFRFWFCLERHDELLGLIAANRRLVLLAVLSLLLVMTLEAEVSRVSVVTVVRAVVGGLGFGDK